MIVTLLLIIGLFVLVAAWIGFSLWVVIHNRWPWEKKGL